MNDLLTRTDMIELTGAAQKEAQCTVLRNSGVRFIIRHDGWPILTATALNNSLSPVSASQDNEYELDLRQFH